MTILVQQQLREATERLIAEGENCWPATVERFTELANPTTVLALLNQVEQLEKSLKLVQSHAHTAYTRGRQAGLADQERTARDAIAAMNLARDQMMDENERFTDLLEKAEQERDQLKAENAELIGVVHAYEAAHDSLFVQCLSNPIMNAWGKQVDVSLLNQAHEEAGKVIDVCQRRREQAITKEQP